MEWLKKIGFDSTSMVVKCALVGIGAGIVNGLFGSGGGLILVPFFASILKMEQKQAFATSVFVILFLSICSIISYSGSQSVTWLEIWPFLVGGAAGGIVGALALKKLPVKWVRRVFALFILWAAVRAFMT